MNITGNKVVIDKSQEELFNFFSDLNNFEK